MQPYRVAAVIEPTDQDFYHCDLCQRIVIADKTHFMTHPYGDKTVHVCPLCFGPFKYGRLRPPVELYIRDNNELGLRFVSKFLREFKENRYG